MIYQVPDPPEYGTRLLDSNGLVWQRVETDSVLEWKDASELESYGYTWLTILSFGPLEEIVEPVAGDIYYRIEDEEYFTVIKVYDGNAWKYIEVETSTSFGGTESVNLYINYEAKTSSDTREWIKA